MGYEPGAAHRLRLVCASSSDNQVRSILSDILGDDSMPFDPRERLLSSVDDAEGPCDLPSLRAMGGELDDLTAGLTAAESADALLALSEHASTLRLVWEAHARGAIVLPPALARRVVHARRTVPSYLGSFGDDRAREGGVTASLAAYPSAIVIEDGISRGIQ
jgi:hypothetical protein